MWCVRHSSESVLFSVMWLDLNVVSCGCMYRLGTMICPFSLMQTICSSVFCALIIVMPLILIVVFVCFGCFVCCSELMLVQCCGHVCELCVLVLCRGLVLVGQHQSYVLISQTPMAGLCLTRNHSWAGLMSCWTTVLSFQSTYICYDC